MHSSHFFYLKCYYIMNNYTLANPQVMGTMQTKYTARNDREAGLMAFREMSQHFSNNVPSFPFTLKRGGDYIHYKAREKVNSTGDVRFTVRKIDKPINEREMRSFIKHADSNLAGGSFSYYDDDDSSSSSNKKSYDYHRKPLASSPITHWQYYPKIYPYQYSYMPQFVQGISPYVYLTFDIIS
jgi:hypothetical protein